MPDLSLTAQRCHAEEVLGKMREGYPGMVRRGRLTPAIAEDRLLLQAAVVETLRQVEEQEAALRDDPAQQDLYTRLRFKYGRVP